MPCAYSLLCTLSCSCIQVKENIDGMCLFTIVYTLMELLKEKRTWMSYAYSVMSALLQLISSQRYCGCHMPISYGPSFPIFAPYAEHQYMTSWSMYSNNSCWFIDFPHVCLTKAIVPYLLIPPRVPIHPKFLLHRGNCIPKFHHILGFCSTFGENIFLKTLTLETSIKPCHYQV